MASRTHLTIRIPAKLAKATRERLLRDAPEELDRDHLSEAYLEDERSICSIANEADCSPQTVLLHLALHGIPLHSSWHGRGSDN
jgi:hypothetical protein